MIQHSNRWLQLQLRFGCYVLFCLIYLLQVFYENRYYLNCIQQLLQSLHSLQIPLPLITTTISNTTNMSINLTNESNAYASKGGDGVGCT